MTPVAIILITISAFAHAFWNFLGKRRQPSVAFFLVANGTASVALLPLLIWYHETLRVIPPAVWYLLVATGFFQAIYFIGLANAYRNGDMSLAYPLARAVPVVLVAIISLAIGRGDQIGRLGIFGMALVAGGCLMLPLPHFRQFRFTDYLSAVCFFALIAAVGTTGYTIIDDRALRLLRDAPSLQINRTEVALLYIALEAIAITLVSTVYALALARERHALMEIWQNSRTYAGITGLVIVITYGLVLMSMAHVKDVSYVAAFRQFSIPVGAVMGMTLQGEPCYRPKLIGITIVFAGLIMVGLG